MQRGARRRTMYLLGSAIALPAAILFACSSAEKHPPASSDNGYIPYQYGTSAGGSEAGVDAATDGGVDASGACDQLPLGDSVSELELPEAQPAPLGGTVADGTYDLQEMDAYNPSGTDMVKTGRSGRITLVVTAGQLRISQSIMNDEAGPAIDTTSAVTYSIQGTSLKTTSLCPSPGTPGEIPFSATGTNVALFVDSQHRELFLAR